MHIVIADAIVRPGSEEAMVDVLTTLSLASRDDQGCVGYTFHQSIEDSTSFTSVEYWDSAEAANAHMQTPHVAAAFAALPDLLAAAPVITMHEVATSTALG